MVTRRLPAFFCMMGARLLVYRYFLSPVLVGEFRAMGPWGRIGLEDGWGFGAVRSEFHVATMA